MSIKMCIDSPTERLQYTNELQIRYMTVDPSKNDRTLNDK